jgi:hypothetical protein
MSIAGIAARPGLNRQQLEDLNVDSRFRRLNRYRKRGISNSQEADPASISTCTPRSGVQSNLAALVKLEDEVDDNVQLTEFKYCRKSATLLIHCCCGHGMEC